VTLAVGAALVTASLGSRPERLPQSPSSAPLASDLDAPDPVEAPLTVSEPSVPVEGCEDDGIALAAAALSRSEALLGDDDVLAVCSAVAAAATRSAACSERVHGLLASAATCGRAYGAVASCAAPSAFYRPEWTRAMLETSAPACRMRLVSSLHQARTVDTPLLTLVRAMADAEIVPERRARTWLALGSLVRTARDGAADVRLAAASLDAQIAARLHRAAGYERIYLLETAGNAACTACTDDVRAALSSGDPGVHRAALASLRFKDDEASVASLCGALRDEPGDLVRELAAWSLRWSASSELTRASCLERAAVEDPSDNVRTTALQSLFALAAHSPAASVALAEITGEEPDGAALRAWLASSQEAELRPFDPLHDLTVGEPR
jgi:hypothetical protein